MLSGPHAQLPCCSTYSAMGCSAPFAGAWRLGTCVAAGDKHNLCFLPAFSKCKYQAYPILRSNYCKARQYRGRDCMIYQYSQHSSSSSTPVHRYTPFFGARCLAPAKGRVKGNRAFSAPLLVEAGRVVQHVSSQQFGSGSIRTCTSYSFVDREMKGLTGSIYIINTYS